MSRPVVLIACCGQKAETACAARDLYRSQLFRKSVAYAERRGLPWAILSAEHGLVMPDDVIAPYDVTLTMMCRAVRYAWAHETRAQLVGRFPGARFVVLAGKHYRAALNGMRCEVPMMGMGIGEQLGFLTRDASTVPICRSCFDGCHAGGEPDFSWRPASDGEACGAADHDNATEG